MTEQEAQNLILHNGKRNCIYSDDYKRLPKDLGYAYIGLRDFCKQQGARDIREWLMTKGIYQDVERDMRQADEAIDMTETAESICAQILDNYPLVGEPFLSDDVLARLFSRAQVIFDRIVENGRAEPSKGECDVIAMAIVQYIKRRNPQEGSKADKQFWPYIYSQFGFKIDNATNTQRIYSALTKAVRGAFLQHDRFFSSRQETQQYYTSLNLHALAPVQSIESLFEILFFFYIKDLEFTYTPEDPIFKALVDSIATRWDEDIELQKELNVRSNAMASGLKALFRERPNFMRTYCEQIVKRIDALVRDIVMYDPNSTLDVLLRQWSAKREESLKERIARERNGNLRSGRKAYSVESIRLCYVLENRRVCILVPPMRLEKRLENREKDNPVLELFQDTNRIYERKMEVYGHLSWTTRELLIYLDETDLDFYSPLNIEAAITYDGSRILERDAKLHRTFIAFNEGGREVSAQASAVGVYYLFADEAAHIDSGDIEPEYLDHKGQLMRLYVDGESVVCVNEYELFLSREREGDIRCYPSISRVNGLRGRRESETFSLYPRAFKLNTRLPEGKRSLNYRISIDDKNEPLSRYCPDGRQEFDLDVPRAVAKRHSIIITELPSDRIACRFDYAILPNASCSMDRALIYDDGTPTTVRVRYDGCEIFSREYPAEGTDWVALSTGHLDYDLEVKLPLVRGTFLDQSIFELPSIIWRERITDATFVKVQCPPDWKCGLYLGAAAVPQNTQDGSFELGNFIKSYRHRERADALTLMLKNAQGQQEKRALTMIAFEEYFTESPVSIEDGVLMWRPEGRYVGGDGDEFRLNLSISEENGSFTYALDVKNAVVDRRFGQDCPCGEFPFSIEKVGRQGLFGREADRVLLEGMLAIGAPEQRRVLNKCLYLTQARCWDAIKDRMINLEMPQTAGCLCDLQFQGYSIPSGESVEYPEYVGDLYFYNAFAREWQYFNARESREYELINPVHVWIISDLMLILQTAEGEAPLIDRQYNSIVHRKLNLPNSILYNRLIQPDYFEYRME